MTMDLLGVADQTASGPESMNELVQAMLLRRLGADPAMRDLLPLLGLPTTGAPDPDDAAAAAVAPAMTGGPTMTGAPAPGAPDRSDDVPALEQTLADAAAALASCQALLAEVAASVGACVEFIGTGSAPPESGPRIDTNQDIRHQHESGRSA